jgi:nucleoside 2-deoxyribosyltransferase
MNLDLPRCYVASPLGFNDPGKDYYRRVLLPALAPLVSIVDPWSFTSEAEIKEAAAAGKLRQLAMKTGRRNADEIRSCTLLVACLDGQEPDSGTVAEVGFAAALGLRCVGLRSDFRASGDWGCVVNLQVESFIYESGGVIVRSLDSLVELLREGD